MAALTGGKPASRRGSITMDIDPRGPRFGAVILNAAFDICLGCQAYLFIQRNLKVRPSA
jgi:hypothetical protein